MRAARVDNEIVKEIFMVSSLDYYVGITLIEVPDTICVGASYVGGVFANPPPPFADYVVDKLAQLTQAYSTAIQQDVQYMGTTFQADTSSQQVLTASLSAGAVPAGFGWLDINNVKVAMTYLDLQGLAGTMLAQGNTAFWKLQSLKAEVRAATTVEEVDAVVW